MLKTLISISVLIGIVAAHTWFSEPPTRIPTGVTPRQGCNNPNEITYATGKEIRDTVD